MDIFVEQIVKKKFGPKDYLIIGASIFAALLLIFLSLLFIKYTFGFSFLILAGICFGVYYVASSRSLEYEYSVTNGDITIDKIINRRRRKRVISADAHNIEEIGKFKPEVLRNKGGYQQFITSEYDDGRESWYFCAHGTKKGNVLIVFTPEDKVLNAMKPFIPRQVAFSVFGRN